MSAGADDLLDFAQVYENFDDAIKDLTYLYASTARRRYMNKAYTLSKDLAKDAQTHHEQGHKIGIVFGREANGLSNYEVNLCDKILVIDNNENFSSLNIAQAVGIIAYELFKIRPRPDLENIQDLCDKADLDNFLQHLISQLEPRGFFQATSKQEHMIQNIKNIYTRIPNLSRSEVKTLRGIIVALSR
jgi:tRNA/rRNA methyltransferase